MARPPLPLGTWGTVTRKEISEGRWRARAKYRDLDGITRRLERFDTSAAKAERSLVQAARDRRKQSGGDTLTAESTVAQLLDNWIDNADDGTRRPQTLDDYRSSIEGHIRPGIGEVRIREATVGNLDRFLRGMAGDGIRKRTRTVLMLAFAYAARLDLVDTNPVRDTSTVRKQSAGVEVPTIADAHRYRAAIAEWCGGNKTGPPRGNGLLEVVDVVLGTGLRPGEVLALRVEDLDIKAGTLTVAGTVVGNQRQPTPKTRKGHRTVRLPAFALKALQQRLDDPLVDLTGMLFPSSTGTVRSRANLDRQLREARPDDLVHITLRALRRLAATTVDQALGLEAASRQLGHSGTAVTERHYVDRPDVGPDVAEALGVLAPQ
ncbi:site-specific integrase [Tomitella biformata]|uniref:site-specific integrase n=1 Tax=Tomitella biformata TaxID=630403 RepID=UPI00046647C5|nr:tyrosine-type recombinase/integrase [Tomitella biformata]